MRVALDERVSTLDRDQDPETQGMALREYAAAQEWIVAGEYMDHASATDLWGLIAERVRAGLARVRRQGKHIGRPQALNGNLDKFIPAIKAGTLSRRAAAKRLGVTVSTVSRAMIRKIAQCDDAQA